MADASQLKRSLYMLADFVGTQVPAILVLNMMDVADSQGITIDTARLSDKLGIPVVPMSAIRKKDYTHLYKTIEHSLTSKPIIKGEALASSKDKIAFIDTLLSDVLTTSKTADSAFTSFDKKALSPVKGKLMAFGIILGITMGFNLMEETGYLARISFLFDHTMSKVGLQGKTIMPFFMGLGCTIAGTTGTRVVDN